MRNSFNSCSLFLLFCLFKIDATSGVDYKGKSIGSLNSYHHQVSGQVYAVNEYTLLLEDFTFDGSANDAFFWAGSSSRPGPQGFILANEYGRTDVLKRYLGKQLTLTLPDNKKITDLKWFSIYDLSRNVAFGDVDIPEDFEPPTKQVIGAFTPKARGVNSGQIEILDSKTIRIPMFSYDGGGKDTHFVIGNGPQPSSKGQKIPDELGYLDNLRSYSNETIVLELTGDKTVFDVDWLSVYDIETKENYGWVLIPDEPNVPPLLQKVVNKVENIMHCVQLHKKLQVTWQVFGPYITIRLAGQVDEKDYMAFGFSGSDNNAQMMGADIAITYFDGFRGQAVDYNVTALSPCIKVLGQYKGVCRDILVGGLDDNQLLTANRENGINIITYRRNLISYDSGDKEFKNNVLNSMIWAIGRMNHLNEPSLHDLYPRSVVKLDLDPNPPIDTCYPFSINSEPLKKESWDHSKIIDSSLRAITATLGPSGGQKGYQGLTGMPSPGLAWYINGHLIPEIWLKRGITYAVLVYGGNNVHSSQLYHPFVITDEPNGGFDSMSEAAQKHTRILAGVQYTLRRQARPIAAGPLCLRERRKLNHRLDDNFMTFKEFNRTLQMKCEPGEPAILEFKPNTSWPDTVYYHSFTQSNMGWKLHIVDKFNAGISSASRVQIFWQHSSMFFYSILVIVINFRI
ncbi:protein Skeletor, isoforms B/C [Daktulosphaira vitifoliae]|uniref:protein Skeletor, isoforms B/C n=1 Tax=Daktulosphaira vitifoliae TaxID=58002 RepID=UPI0021A98A20|nr:protein Skeletor, isoforms B/C [Daktulosphaira vitifoliae]